jgi:hypothetical protein
VSDNPGTFSLTGVDVGATTGLPFNQVVAILHESSGSASADNLTATIGWGDGTPLDTGRVIESATPGFFQVLGTHAYGHTGSDTIHVWVRDNSTAEATGALASATVTTAPVGSLGVTGVGVSTTAGQPFTQVVAVIQDTNVHASAGNLTATISWGDGSSVQTVPVSPTGTAGLFQLVAGHTYAMPGTDQITIWVQDNGDAQSATGSSTATVTGAPVLPPPPAPAAPAPAPFAIVPVPTGVPRVIRRHHRVHHRSQFVFAQPLAGFRPNAVVTDLSGGFR